MMRSIFKLVVAGLILSHGKLSSASELRFANKVHKQDRGDSADKKTPPKNSSSNGHNSRFRSMLEHELRDFGSRSNHLRSRLRGVEETQKQNRNNVIVPRKQSYENMKSRRISRSHLKTKQSNLTQLMNLKDTRNQLEKNSVKEMESRHVDALGGNSLVVATMNLYWWNLFRDRHGGDFYNRFRRYGPYDLLFFQECEDVEQVIRGLHYDMETYSPGEAVALAWKRGRFRKVGQGSAVVGHDRLCGDGRCDGNRCGCWGERIVAWVRLHDNVSNGNILALSHHGPLPVDTGGQHGMPEVARLILKAINDAKHDGDVVILGGDFNAGGGSRTIQLLSQDLKHEENEWVDNIFTSQHGFDSDPEKTIIRGTGSDHRGIKLTWGSPSATTEGVSNSRPASPSSSTGALPSCNDVEDTDADGHTCGARIAWVMRHDRITRDKAVEKIVDTDGFDQCNCE